MRKFADCFIRESIVVFMISLNALALFLDSFPGIADATQGLLWKIDYLCVIYFLLEITIKLVKERKAFWNSGWNRFDFSVVFLSLPSLAAPWTQSHVFAALLLLRIPRLFRFLRLFRFVPQGPKYWVGVKRSLRACVGIFTVLIIVQLVFALGANILFGRHDPENFGDPGQAFYTMFKFLTVDGWSTIPDNLVKQGDLPIMAFFVKAYFIAAVLIGGVLGLSISNAIFVDAMTADNTVKVEHMVAALQEEVRQLKEEIRRRNGSIDGEPSGGKRG